MKYASILSPTKGIWCNPMVYTRRGKQFEYSYLHLLPTCIQLWRGQSKLTFTTRYLTESIGIWELNNIILFLFPLLKTFPIFKILWETISIPITHEFFNRTSETPIHPIFWLSKIQIHKIKYFNIFWISEVMRHYLKKKLNIKKYLKIVRC